MAHLSGWTYRRALPIPSSAWSLSGDVSDFTMNIVLTSALAEFWALVKSDGGDVRFTASDGTTLLKKVTVKFDSTGDEAVYKVKIPTIAAASDPTIYVYCGNASATTDDDGTNAFSSAVRACFGLDLNYSGGAFIDFKNGLSGTNNGTTDAADQLTGARGRTVSAIVPNDIQINDNDLLSFGDGATDTDISVVANVKMTDATRFRICSKGNTASTDAEYHFVATGGDTLAFQFQDKSTVGYINRVSTNTLTADEGSWVRLIATKTGSTLALYRNATVMAGTTNNSGTYTAMENTATYLNIGSYYHTAEATGSGVIGELMLLAEVVSADWMKCYEYACSGSWISWGAQEFFIDDTGTGTDAVSVNVGASLITITDTGSGADEVTGFTIALSIGDTGSGADSILVYSGDLHSVTETGTGLDTLVSLVASLAIADTASGADGINVSGMVTPDVILESAHGFGIGGATEYKIVDEYQQIVQNWTTAGVFEVPEDGLTSSYSVKIGRLSQYIIYWRIPGTKYKARRTVNLFESNNDAQTSSRLASTDFIAPDNAGIAALQTDTALLLSLIRNKKYLEKVGAAWYLVIRNDGDTADILRKVLKGPDGIIEISDIAAAALGMEMKSSV